MQRINSKHITEISAIIYFCPLKEPWSLKQNLSLWKTHFLLRNIKTKQVKNFKKLLHRKCCTRLNQIFISSCVPSLAADKKSSAQGRAEWVCWEAAPEHCPGSNWQHRMLSARAAGCVISSFQCLLLWEAPCLSRYCGNLSPICYYSCAQEFPCSAAGHMKIHIPVAQHVMKKALGCFSSAHIPVSFSVYRALSTTPCQLLSKVKPSHFLGQRLCCPWSSPACGWAFLTSAISPLRHGNRIPQNIQHVGTSGIYTASQIDISYPPSE